MPLAESLILVVAPAIAKTVLKLWAGDEKLASESGGAAIEALGKLIPEIRARNEASRQLDAEGLGGLEGGQDDGLIRAHARGWVDGMRVAPLEQDVLLGSHDEERRAEGEHEEALEIDVGPIHDVEGAGLGEELVEDVDVVRFYQR